MQSVFNAALLARLRRQTAESMQNLQGLAIGAGDRPGNAAHEVGDLIIERPVQYDPETEKPVTAGDKLSDLDVITGDIAHLPEMPVSWWEQMVLGEGDAWVSVANVHLVFRHIEQRLADRATATGPPQPYRYVRAASLLQHPDRRQGRALLDCDRDARHTCAPGLQAESGRRHKIGVFGGLSQECIDFW